ncbi:flagellar biosynthesis anti-sigma factor FlgM [Plastorhodobacter daqingensis]|uniref:Flagellar biosynthesis anti-sigma factor FlgM n=1 Tax=Plastorhodobacter daqingensis TaxID=1387281 RepID=A0ABW2UK07_9RHOB
MVDPLLSGVQTIRTPRAQEDVLRVPEQTLPPAGPAAVTATDTVEMSPFAPRQSLAQIPRDPPVDLEAVSRIREAIAAGNYPLDLDRITERLMESFLDMTS